MEQQKKRVVDSPISERAFSHPSSFSPQSDVRPSKRLCSLESRNPGVFGQNTHDDCESLVSKALPKTEEHAFVPSSLSKPTVIFDADPHNVIIFPSCLWRRSSPLESRSDCFPAVDVSAVLYETSPSLSIVRETEQLQQSKAQKPIPGIAGCPSSAAIEPVFDPEVSAFLAKQISPSDIPSPPSTSSSDKQPYEHHSPLSRHKPAVGIDENFNSTEHGSKHEVKREILKEESKAPACSENSEFFSFSRQPSSFIRSSSQVDTSEPLENLPSSMVIAEAVEVSSSPSHQPQQRYYTKAFNFVIQHVIKRYGHILKSVDVDLVRLMQSALSENGIALFVRLYRRKQPHWYRVGALKDSYIHELDVESGLRELCSNAMLISSDCAAKVAGPIVLLLARELLPSLDLAEMRDVCSSVVEGNILKKRPKIQLLPGLRDILTETIATKRRKIAAKRKQMTLTGKSPGECLATAILKRAGICVRVPTNILTSLARIHFLFFFESGHDSPDVILAETGKVKFPSYLCEPSKLIFPSARAYEDYEQALSLEKDLNDALENRYFENAAYFGSLAELEVREFFGWSQVPEDSSYKNSRQELNSGFSKRPLSSVGGHGWLSKRPQFQKVVDKMEAETQLKHPFFKRFTALWVYVRASWHSVHALERLGEYEGAISRLKLLLRTELMARRRGKCLNRLTINMFKHVQRYEEALQIITDSLGDNGPRLHYGDRMQLAHRGVAIHRKIHLPDAERKTKRLYGSAASRKKAAVSEVTATRPQVFTSVLQANETQIAVRKIFGKSLKIQSRDRRRSIDAIEDPWQRFLAENSRDSVGDSSLDDRNIMGKAIFQSFRGDGSEVSVEDYCLEWYFCKEGWGGNHTEGGAIRFIFGLMMWESVIFKAVPDVFQTPYQDRPLDLMTEAFFESRKDAIESRLREISELSNEDLREEVSNTYEKHEGTRALGCIWNVYSKEDITCIACGLGTQVIARCCKLLCEDYGYWSGGLPDLTLWKVVTDGDQTTYNCKLVEVKSARDHLSEKQRAWLIELSSNNADCEVCKVVEKVTSQNANHLEAAKLNYEAIKALTETTTEEE